MKKYIIGIDPGSSNGGIVTLNRECEVVKSIKCPDTDKDILEILKPYEQDAIVYIEKLWGNNGLMGSKASIWTQAENYGMLKMAIIALGMRMEEVVPGRWQKHYGIKKEKNQAPKDWKAVLKDRAQKLFPQEKVTLWNADALLIAKYGYDQEKFPVEN